MSDDRRIVGGRYAIVSTLGEGGFGSVLLARQVATGQEVVLKRVPLRDARLAAVFKREASILRRIDSPRMARFVDFFVEEGDAYLVQEYVAGAVPLDAWLRGQQVTEVLRVTGELAAALASLHAQGFAHRDVKPSNVLVRDGMPVLIDFGLTVSLHETDELTTTAGNVVGTPLFMAPEALRGGAELGPPADVYALGLVLYQALTGELPEGRTDTIGELLVRRVTATAHADRRALGALPAIADLIDGMLAPSPDARPSAGAVGEILAREQRALAARPEVGALVVPLAASISAAPGAPSFATTSAAAPPMAGTVPIPAPPTTLTSLPELAPDSRAHAMPSPPRASRAPWAVMVAILAVLAAVAAFVPLGVGLPSVAPALWLGLFAVASLAALLALRARRRAVLTAPLAPSTAQRVNPEIAQRIAAVEAHVARNQELTQSLALSIESLVSEKLEHAIRRSMLVALREMPAAMPATSELARALALVEKLVTQAPPQKKPLHERLTALLALPAALIAVAVALVGLLGSLDVWRPKRPPEVQSFGGEHLRARPGGVVLLSVDARDPDGDPLSYRYRASAGRLEGSGPTVRWLAPPDAVSSLVRVGVDVTDGRHVITKETTITIQPAPTASIHVPREVTAAAGAEELRVTAESEAPLRYEWRVSGGELLQSSGAVVFWKSPAAPGSVEVVCEVSDDLGTVPLVTAILVKRPR